MLKKITVAAFAAGLALTAPMAAHAQGVASQIINACSGTAANCTSVLAQLAKTVPAAEFQAEMTAALSGMSQQEAEALDEALEEVLDDPEVPQEVKEVIEEEKEKVVQKKTAPPPPPIEIIEQPLPTPPSPN